MLKSIKNALRGGSIQRQIRKNRISFPPSYYTATGLKANLEMYTQAVEAIKAKYEKYDLNEQNISTAITNELKLAKINFDVRARNYSLNSLKEGIALERAFGNTARADEFKRLAAQLDRRNKLMETKSMAKWAITDNILKDISTTINPYGQRTGDVKDWPQVVDFLETKLAETNIDLEEKNYNQLVEEVWTAVHQEAINRSEQEQPQGLATKLTSAIENKPIKTEPETNQPAKDNNLDEIGNR